jgi:hypothetical protein
VKKIAFLMVAFLAVLMGCPEAGQPVEFGLGPRDSYLEELDGDWGDVNWVNSANENDYLLLDKSDEGGFNNDDIVRYNCLSDVRVQLDMSLNADGAGPFNGDIGIYKYDSARSLETSNNDFIARIVISGDTQSDTFSGIVEFKAGHTYKLHVGNYANGLGPNRTYSATMRLVP